MQYELVRVPRLATSSYRRLPRASAGVPRAPWCKLSTDMRAGDVRLGACALLLLAAVATADRPWKYTACPGKQEQGNHAGVMCKGLSEAQLCGQDKVTAGSAEVVFGDREKHFQRYKAMKLTLDLAGSGGCSVSDPQFTKVTDPYVDPKLGKKLRQKCYCEAENKCSQYPPYTSENIQQEWNTRYAFFNTVTKSCEEYGRDERVTPGCVPFTNMEKCSLACHKYSSHTAGELEEEAEEDAIEITKFAYHAFIMLYMCFGLALVCEDFFVASLEIIIDKLKLPPDVAGATFMAAGSSSPELFVAAVAVFMLPDTGHRCVLNAPGSTPDAPVFAGYCESPDDNLGWLTDPLAKDQTGRSPGKTVLDACTLVEGANWAGQRIYIDEGVGVGAVVGSTMFNTLCIIGGSAIVSGKISKLDWRIIMRDGTSYMVAIITLAIILNGGEADEPEPILAFFSVDSESCQKTTLSHTAASDITREHNAGSNSTRYKELNPAFEYCEPKVYGVDAEGNNDELAVVSGTEACVLLVFYFTYVLLCAVYARIMDKFCPSYGKSNQIGFAEMGAATTSFDANDRTARIDVDGFEAYKQNRLLQNKRTMVARQLVGSILRGEASYDTLVGNAPAPSVAPEGTATLSEGLSGGGSAGEGGGGGGDDAAAHAQAVFDSKLFDAGTSSLAQLEAVSAKDASDYPLDDIEEGGEHADGHEAHHEHNIFKVPAGNKARVFWMISFPLLFFFTYTIPDCRKPSMKKWYLGTFFAAIMWMGLLVDIMVEHAVEGFHENLHIPMG
jgi:hypothetical protein